MDRRALFFVGAAIACFLLTAVALPEHRPIAETVGTWYLVLAVLSALDRRSRHRR
jgi:hypothetical protein